MKYSTLSLLIGTIAIISILLGCTAPPTPTPLPAPPAATLAPPTTTLIPPTATATRIPPAPTALPKDARGFSILETEHATLLAESGVGDDNGRAVGELFEIGYQVVGEDLGYADKRPRLYVYLTDQSMYQDLIAVWGYSEWLRTVNSTPRMHPDYIEWIPPRHRQDDVFIAHEYSHRIIEQIAGLNSQVNFKWFDEGLAEYEGLRALAKRSPSDAASQRGWRINLVGNNFGSGALIPLKDITSEKQWSTQMERSAQLVYAQAWAAMDYLISQRGITQVKNVLTLVGKGQSFPDAFQNVYGLSVNDFEKEFLTFVANSKKESDATTCFKIDGQGGDWQKLKPLIVDDPNPSIARAADVREVYAVTCKGALYVMIAVDGPATSGTSVSYGFDVDTNGDGMPEYQAGFDRTRAWLWNLRGTGYADQKNLSFPVDVRASVGQVAEAVFALKLLDDTTTPRIRVYTGIGGQTAKRKTVWAQVQPLETK